MKRPRNSDYNTAPTKEVIPPVHHHSNPYNISITLSLGRNDSTMSAHRMKLQSGDIIPASSLGGQETRTPLSHPQAKKVPALTQLKFVCPSRGILE